MLPRQSQREIDTIREEVERDLRSRIKFEDEKQRRIINSYIYGDEIEEEEEFYQIIDDDIW